MTNAETSKYIQRVTDAQLDFKLKSKGAVLITGPKWCGKTTSAKRFAKSYVEFGGGSAGKQLVLLAKTETEAVLDGETPRLFDEWQEVPELWDAIRSEVDRRNLVGQFILTGSTVVNYENIVHSGTGRFAFMQMRPMSLFESGESNGKVSLASLFQGDAKIAAVSDLSLKELAFATCRGGWPFSIALKGAAALAQAVDYYDALVYNDISRVDGVKRSPEMAIKLLREYARYQGSAPSNAALAGDLGVSEETIASYLGALGRVYAIEPVAAWNPNLRSKSAIRSSSVCYFVDPSLATAALKIDPEGLIADLNTFGFVFETLCIRDLRTYASTLNGAVYHFRDKRGREVDAVVALPDGSYGLVEIKLGQIDEVMDVAAKTLNSISEDIDETKMKAPAFKMILTGNGKVAYRREDGVYVVPIGCLRP